MKHRLRIIVDSSIEKREYLLSVKRVHSGRYGESSVTLAWFAGEQYLVESYQGIHPFISVPHSLLCTNPHPKRRIF